jgi:hypothetical protein
LRLDQADPLYRQNVHCDGHQRKRVKAELIEVDESEEDEDDIVDGDDDDDFQ